MTMIESGAMASGWNLMVYNYVSKSDFGGWVELENLMRKWWERSDSGLEGVIERGFEA
ncbi:MAG TPA: hypothetical protein VH255_05795 [Verrucomicrobiae bacterium]|nr:hypothetical protein [Verrucomicrobiae bacterium]